MLCKVSRVLNVQNVNSEYEITRVVFSEGIQAYLMMRKGEAFKYIDKNVIVTFRDDLFDGKIAKFVNTLTVHTEVNVISTSAENFKLFSDSEDSNCNVSFQDIKLNETVEGAIVYCVSSEYKSSDKSNWINLQILDKFQKKNSLKLFSPEVEDANYKGVYIRADITRTQWGFQTKSIVLVDGEFARNAEIDIAIEYIKKYFKDKPFYEIIEDKKILQLLESSFEHGEKGYSLAYLASDLYILSTVQNLLDTVVFDTVEQAVVARYLYACFPNRKFSPNIASIQIGVHYKFKTEALQLLDDYGEDSMERRLLNYITRMSAEIIELRNSSKVR